MLKTLENIQKYSLYILVILYPVFVLTIFSNPLIVPKEILLIVLSTIAILAWLGKTIYKGEFSFSVGKFDLGVLLVILAYLVSAILRTPNKMEAFLLPGTATLYIVSGIVYFLFNQLDKKGKTELSFALLGSALVFSISILFAQTGVLAKIPQLPAFIKDASFNTLGGSLPSVIYLGTIMVFSLGLVLREKDIIKKLFVGVSSAIILLALIASIINILPGKSQALNFPGFQTSWVVSVEALKESPLWGVGPANYLSAFNMFKPLDYNQTALWQARFTIGQDFYLTMITEAGFAGIIAFFVLLMAIYRYLAKDLKFSFEKLTLLTVVVLFAVLPTVPLLIILLFVILSLMSGSEDHVKNIILNVNSKAPAILMCLPIVIGLGFLYFFGVKIALAEVTFQKSLDALSANDAKTTYDLMNKAINQNSTVDRYHASFAQVNMALASSLATKKDLTDTDKTTISQLVQQAINEGKNNAILNPQRSGNWELLAGIYRSIMPFAQGADNFAIQTYTQAITLDPTNPNLRIELGGVYYALGRFDDAIATFKLAILAKPDLANAHYNLAVAYREKKDFDNAITEMNTVLTLVPKGSADYTLAQNTLSDLQKNKPATKTTSTTGTDLTTPQAAQKSNVTPPIKLPADSTPPTQ